MAGGKLSPRQKMINLMYLVFLAMLAMQMDKKVLSSFGFMKEKIEDANKVATSNNNNALTSLATKATEQKDKFGALNEKAQEVNTASNQLFDYLESLKSKMSADIKEEDKANYESQKSPDKVDELLFNGEKLTPEGTKFVAEINTYNSALKSILGDKASAELITNIDKRFNTNPDIAEDGGQKIEWIRSRYEGMPLITSIANVSQIQGDVKTTEAEIYSKLVGGQLESEVSMSNYNGIVALDKNAFYPGEKVTGSVVLGRYDATLKPTRVEFNGNKDYKNFKDGSVVVDMPAGAVGDKKIKGTIYFTENGEEIPVPFESTYSVIPKPNEAVISADKMNVVYRGLDNPITISMPGVPGNKVTAKAAGLKRIKGDSYMMRPGSGNQVNIKVTGMLDGKPVTSSKPFRIKDIPPAVGMVRNQYGAVKLPKSSVAKIVVAAGLPDFLFDLKLNVSSFKIKVPGQVAIPVNGTRLNARAKKALQRARRNDVITIFDIKAAVSGSNYKLKKVLPVSIEITN